MFFNSFIRIICGISSKIGLFKHILCLNSPKIFILNQYLEFTSLCSFFDRNGKRLFPIIIRLFVCYALATIPILTTLYAINYITDFFPFSFKYHILYCQIFNYRSSPFKVCQSTIISISFYFTILV